MVTLAYEHGQLSYTNENNYSNYIGWYADKDGKITFTAIDIDKADEYFYTVKEVKGYGTLKIEYAYVDKNNEGKDAIVFENKYTEPAPSPESPKTGDATNPFLWFALMFISGGITFAAGRKLRRLSK